MCVAQGELSVRDIECVAVTVESLSVSSVVLGRCSLGAISSTCPCGWVQHQVNTAALLCLSAPTPLVGVLWDPVACCLKQCLGRGRRRMRRRRMRPVGTCASAAAQAALHWSHPGCGARVPDQLTCINGRTWPVRWADALSTRAAAGRAYDAAPGKGGLLPPPARLSSLLVGSDLRCNELDLHQQARMWPPTDA